MLSAITYLLSATLRMGTPIAYTALGGMTSERSGVNNIGLEGIMTASAFGAVVGSYLFQNPWPGYLGDLAVIWVGNLLGAMLIAGVETLTGVGAGLQATAAALVAGKMGDGYLSLFLLGILCNICIFIAVNGYAKNPHQMGKYLALFLGVTVFIVSGMEHSVADMYYWSVSGVLYGQPGESLLRLVVISLGNVVGGVFFPVVEAWKAKLEAVKAEVT